MKEAFFKFLHRIAIYVLAYIYKHARKLCAIIYLKLAKLKGGNDYGKEN